MKLENIIRETLLLDETVEISDLSGPGVLQGWDSLGHVAIISALENTYGIAFELDEVMSIENVETLKKMLIKKGVSDF